MNPLLVPRGLQPSRHLSQKGSRWSSNTKICFVRNFFLPVCDFGSNFVDLQLPTRNSLLSLEKSFILWNFNGRHFWQHVRGRSICRLPTYSTKQKISSHTRFSKIWIDQAQGMEWEARFFQAFTSPPMKKSFAFSLQTSVQKAKYSLRDFKISQIQKEWQLANFNNTRTIPTTGTRLPAYQIDDSTCTAIADEWYLNTLGHVPNTVKVHPKDLLSCEK